MIQLIRVPSKRYARVRPEYRDRTNKYDYVTADGRWYIEKHTGCGGGWTITDNEFLDDSSCGDYAAIVRTLAEAKVFIARATKQFPSSEEEMMADLAAVALERLAAVRNQFGDLAAVLSPLARWTAEHHPGAGPDDVPLHEFLAWAASSAHHFTCCVPEAVRDVAVLLPVYGIDR